MKNPACVKIRLAVKPKHIPFFYPLLRKGILIYTETGLCLRELVCERMGIQNDYLNTQVQTIFLDGKVLDDRHSAVIRGGSTLALSAAMPGMVGATFRSSGFYAPFRSPISYAGGPASVPDHKKPVLVKCFNKIANDHGPMLLAAGIYIYGEDLRDLVVSRLDDFHKGLGPVVMDDRTVDPAIPRQTDWDENQVFLQVREGP